MVFHDDRINYFSVLYVMRRGRYGKSHFQVYSSVADTAPQNFADVPQIGSLTGGLLAVFRPVIIQRRCLCAAVHTDGIPAPAAFLLQQTGTTAVRAVLHQNFFMNTNCFNLHGQQLLSFILFYEIIVAQKNRKGNAD